MLKLVLLVVSILLAANVVFLIGWICGAGITADDIANAVEEERLALGQPAEEIAAQIRSGRYKSKRSSQ